MALTVLMPLLGTFSGRRCRLAPYLAQFVLLHKRNPKIFHGEQVLAICVQKVEWRAWNWKIAWNIQSVFPCSLSVQSSKLKDSNFLGTSSGGGADPCIDFSKLGETCRSSIGIGTPQPPVLHAKRPALLGASTIYVAHRPACWFLLIWWILNRCKPRSIEKIEGGNVSW